MVSLHEEEEPNGRYKEQRGAEVPHSSEPKKANLTGVLLLWCKMLAIRCFVWAPGLQLWSGSE